MIYDVVIIGAGASGCMASVVASRNGAKVLVLEKNEKIGKKLFVTGKGRCNLTNNCDVDEFLNNVVNGRQFLNGAIRKFAPQNTINFFECEGLKLKTERGNRVFPLSDKSSDVIKVFEKLIKENDVELKLNTAVKDISNSNNLYHIKCNNGETYTTYNVILATGGKSYTATGSDGFGYDIAKKFGHKINEPRPSLVPIILNDDVKELEGLSLKNVECKIEVGGKKFKEFGEMLFTNEGVSGPIILTLSAYVNKFDLSGAKMYIDFKPALDEEFLDQKLIREFNENSNKNLSTYLKTLLPMSLVPYFIKKSQIFDKKLSQINKLERKIVLSLLKRFDFSIKMLDNINKAIVTSGGVDLKEINPKTMESKLIKGLYFVGEVLDIDALTGGFNLQIAFSTGFVAGNNIVMENL